MEQQKALHSANIHTSARASTRSLTYDGARRHACMNNWKNTNPSSGLDGTTKSIH